jgi:segregation and condensation protein B
MPPSATASTDEVEIMRDEASGSEAPADLDESPSQGEGDKSTQGPVDDVVAEKDLKLPRVDSREEALSIIEALLFSSNQPLSARRLATMLPGWTEAQVKEMLTDLQQQVEDSNRGLMIEEVAGGWTMATRPQWAEWVFSLHRARRRNPLTPQALETLAIVAYRQPITRADIEVIRGVDAGGMLRSLLDLGLVEIAGHRETLGRPPLYGTTMHFLRTFGLNSLSDLPAVEELRQLLPKEVEEPEPRASETQETDGDADEFDDDDREDEEDLEDESDGDEFDDDDDDDEDAEEEDRL